MSESVLFPLGLVLASSDLAFQRALAISLQHLILPGSAMEPSKAPEPAG